MSGAVVVRSRIPSPTEWDDALEEAGVPYRFSHRGAAGRVLEAAYPGYHFEPRDVAFEDGTRLLLPLVRVQRRVEDLTLHLGMPLEWEGTPVVARGSLDEGKIRGVFEEMGGRGALRIIGGPRGSLPTDDANSEQSTHVLDLRPGFDSIWETAFSGKNRNSCRKAQRSGVQVARDSGPGRGAVYYDLYAEASRGWGHAEPPYPRALIEALASSEHVDVWLARVQDQPVAGAVILKGTHDVFYWSGAMDRTYQSAAPSNELLRAVVEWSCSEGFDYMDFGASEGLPGVRKFKESFGAGAVPVHVMELAGQRHRALEGFLKATRRLRPTGDRA